MFNKVTFIIEILTIFCIQTTMAHELDGTWHLRVIDGMDVRKARAILEFDMAQKKLTGFDACNRIEGNITHSIENNTSIIPTLKMTKMACRKHIHSWTSRRLDKTLKEGFSIKFEKKYGIKGTTLKSPTHTLFLKKMQKDK